MSLRGRKFFDVLQHHPASLLNASRFRLPCPPYHTADYWERIYKDMNVENDDVIEWGGFDLQNGLLKFRYETVLHYKQKMGGLLVVEPPTKENNAALKSSTFAECMGIRQLSTPEDATRQLMDHPPRNESVLILGCGNSKVGEQLLKNSFVGPILQIDISSKIIQLMSQRYERYLSGASVKRMELIVDDARRLSAICNNSVYGGVIDKGLIDVLHCSMGMISPSANGSSSNKGVGHDKNPIQQIVDSVHRVLQPLRPFIFFSHSEPDYILRRFTCTDDRLNYDVVNDEMRMKWKDIQVLKMVDLGVLMYRFVKAEPKPVVDGSAQGKKEKKKRKLRIRSC